MGRAVDHAQGAHPAAVAQLNRRAGVEPDAGPVRHQRVVGKARVQGDIGHLENLLVEDFVGAEGDVSGRLGGSGQADVGLERLPLGIDQADQRDRRSADDRGHPDQRVQRCLGVAVEHIQRPHNAARRVASSSGSLAGVMGASTETMGGTVIATSACAVAT